MSSRRQARKQSVAPELTFDQDPRHVYRLSFQTLRYGHVTVSFRGPDANRILYQRTPGTEGQGNWCLAHWDPARFAQIMADPEIAQGIRQALKHKGNPTG